jgi:AI-2 transport protein TqsA
MSDLTGNYGGLILFFSDFTLTLLLCIYMLSTRIPRTVKDAEIEEEDPHHMTLFMKVESSIRNYIILKTKLSLLTGFLVGAVLGLARVKLWFVFGVLTFVLNFIPNFGSLIAMFLPVPILIVDACGEGKTEDCLEPVQQALAFIVPAIIQGIIGNAVEPSLFGKSLN